MRLARITEADFHPSTRANGRALVRRRRVRVLDHGGGVACMEVRAAEGPHVVLLVGCNLRACSCDGGTPLARCAHAWAAILASDRLSSAPSEIRARS